MRGDDATGSLFEADRPHYGSTSFPPARAFQDLSLERLRDGVRAGHKNQLLMCPTGGGKCLGRGTPVLMADGSIRAVETIVAGDRLMGPDGNARNVLSVASGRETLYRVHPTKGDSYVVNASHLLSLRVTPGASAMVLADGSRIDPDDDVVAVRADVFLQSNATARHCLKGWRAPAIERFERDDEEFFIPPYLLGAWLGDGTAGRAALSKPECRMTQEWCDFGRSIGYGISEAVQEGCTTYLLTPGHDGHSINVIQESLRVLGVLHRKHIPDAYKLASINVRRELLAGLIDSDGHITHKGCDWISVSQEMAEGFAFLCRSVGLSCYLSKQKKGIKSIGFEGWYWRASVSGDLSALPMRDKVAEPREQKKRHLVHGIKLECLGEGDYFGFEIDGDRLFLLGDFTVTHNTYIAMRLTHEALLKGKRVVFVADRNTLINQTSETADRYGIAAHGIIQANHPRTDKSMPFQIASAQTLARRQWPDADLIVVDEAHTQLKAWTDHIPDCRAKVVGLSATPFSKGLGKIFSNLINATTAHELTLAGVLVPMRVQTCVRPDMEGAATAGGEWTDKAAEERGMTIVGDVVAEWIKHAENRKTIVFGSTIAHCEELARQFNESDVNAALFTSHTKEEERKTLLDDFRRPDSRVRVLISVEALAKGFDVPDVGCVVDARPLRKSLSTAIQMWGRGLRASPETGKVDCLLLDHSGNIVRFAKDYADIFFNGLSELDAGEKLDSTVRKEPEEKEPKGCPACGAKPFAGRCMSCGHEPQSASLVVAVPGVMREMQIGNTKKTLPAYAIWQQACTYARAHSTPEKQAGRAANIYRDITGLWPDRASMRFQDTPNTPITREISNQIRFNNIKFAKSRAA